MRYLTLACQYGFERSGWNRNINKHAQTLVLLTLADRTILPDPVPKKGRHFPQKANMPCLPNAFFGCSDIKPINPTSKRAKQNITRLTESASKVRLECSKMVLDGFQGGRVFLGWGIHWHNYNSAPAPQSEIKYTP